jgi:hypothetical protein
MEKTGVVGEYWCGGEIQSMDGITGWGSLCKFNKNNITTINSTLKYNGLSTRNNFNLYYNGQSIQLINLDNTYWMVLQHSSQQPFVILY